MKSVHRHSEQADLQRRLQTVGEGQFDPPPTPPPRRRPAAGRRRSAAGAGPNRFWPFQVSAKAAIIVPVKPVAIVLKKEDSMVRTTTALLGLVVTSLSIDLFAQDATSTKAIAGNESQSNRPAPCDRTTDAEGEPSPVGALARLGNIRWRHGGNIIGSALSHDGKRLATVSPESVAVYGYRARAS